MKNKLNKVFNRTPKLFMCLVIGLTLTFSCADPYLYDDEEPEWLGESIYDYLEEDGHFKNYIRLINDLNYDDVLKLTGSKTLFVANDSAFTEFYKNNAWGVSNYDQLTLAQKKYLFKFSMIDNAYILSRLANFNVGGTLYEGIAMRQETALEAVDSIPFVKGDDLPSSAYWDGRREKGIYLMKDNTAMPTVFFTQAFINKYGFSNEDLSIMLGLNSRSLNDVHVFNNKVIQRDITCKNGYIHVLQSVMAPPTNMAQYIQDNNGTDITKSTKIFSKLLDRFCAPYFDAEKTLLYRQLNPMFTDSIFTKRYFASNGGRATLPNGKVAPNLLSYDPGWNSYQTTAIEADMAAMFVPSDAAMENYFNSGVGAILKSRFGSWEGIPDNIILPFIKRHMRTSLIESTPSRFSKMVDAENYALPVEKSHIEKTYTAVNGEVYVTNEVYPPVDYISVYSPVLLSDNSKIMNWAINISEQSVDGTLFQFYKLYLNSLVSRYSLFIPTDEFFDSYIDPIAYGQDVPAVIKFKYIDKTSSVTAYIYKYDKTSGSVVSDVPVDSITTTTFVKNRLWSILDSHIVVGDVENGSDYFITKANDIIKVTGSGASMKVQGGDDINKGVTADVEKVFEQYNGSTYFLNKPIQPALKSVYKALSEDTEHFGKFFELLNGVPDTCINQIFAQQGIDFRIKFFNAFRYTVYAPTDAAIDAAISSGKIKSWDEIYAISDPAVKSREINRMIRILKYHFQDNAVFANQVVNKQFQSATIKNDNAATRFGTSKNKYYKIGVVGNGTTLTLTMDNGSGDPVKTANVITTDGRYNIIVKDYIFAKVPTLYKNVDGTGSLTGTAFSSSTITTSASAVIHQIDNVLTFE